VNSPYSSAGIEFNLAATLDRDCPLSDRSDDDRWVGRAQLNSVLPSDNEVPELFSRQVIDARRFHLHPKPCQSRGVTVVCGGWEECASNYRVDRETFPFYSVEFVAAGEGAVTLAGKEHKLVPGTVFTYGPGIDHHFATSKRRLFKYFVSFEGSDALRILSECQVPPGSVMQSANTGEVHSAFDTLVRLGTTHHGQTARVCALQTELLVRCIAGSVAPQKTSGRRALATFERSRQKIDEHFLELATLEDAAAVCHVEISHLCRLFRRFQRESPYRYLQRLQMQWAARRLQSSDLFIREVADELRVNQFQFSRVFKRVHGVSPSVFLSLPNPSPTVAETVSNDPPSRVANRPLSESPSHYLGETSEAAEIGTT